MTTSPDPFCPVAPSLRPPPLPRPAGYASPTGPAGSGRFGSGHRAGSFRRAGVGLLLVLFTGCARGLNAEYENADVGFWVSRFEAESREVYKNREQVMQAAGVEPGMHVADIGAGTGFFTELFARRVGPAGRVYAVDITPNFLRHIAERAEQQGLFNVVTVLCSDTSASLPAGAIDLAFICDTYHHFEQPARTLASIHRALRPGGWLVIVDFDRQAGKSRQWVLDHVRAGLDVFRAEITAAGFEFADRPAAPWLSENYLVRFRKPSEAAAPASR
jgi:SAM-dependent methyltransferase